MSELSKQIIESSKITLEAAKFVNGSGVGQRLPSTFDVEPKKLETS